MGLGLSATTNSPNHPLYADIESTRAMIDRVYAQVHAQRKVDPGSLSLILTLCANIGFFWTIGSHGTNFFHDKQIARKVSTQWTKHALVAMEQSRIATSTTSLETIQASILLMFLLYHMEGFTFRVRMMHAAAVTMARDLGLHKTDMHDRPPPTDQSDVIDREVRRMLWWHLASTDWTLAFIGGPHEGMYAIHPRHMKVDLPRNINREDLTTKDPGFQRSLSEPTIMSYYLQRVRLAHTCREMCDALFKFSKPTEADYDLVRMLDSKLETQLQELPRFLRFDLPTKQLQEEYGDAYDRQTTMQAITVNLMLSTRRCKLHLPYLIRARTNPMYAWSRRIGLQAARSVFNVRRVVMEDGESAGAAQLKLGGIRQHLFYATTVLVMDLCVNRNEGDQGQLAEVREALQIIQDSNAEGQPAGPQLGDKFYDSLMAVLRKHHVKLPNTTKSARNSATTNEAHKQPATSNHASYSTPQFYSDSTPGSGSGAGISSRGAGHDIDMTLGPTNPFANQDNSGLAFDPGMWADFIEQAPMMEAQDWDALLTDLDMRLI